MQTFFQSELADVNLSFVAAFSLGGKMMHLKLSVWSFISLPLCLCPRPLQQEGSVYSLSIVLSYVYVGACKNLIILECNIILAKYLNSMYNDPFPSSSF